MSLSTPKPRAGTSSEKAVAKSIASILSDIRVPELPYPAGKQAPVSTPDWRPLLLSCWTEQRDERVTRVLQSVEVEWTIRQVNAAYLSDRIMDVYLKTSGLHPTLVSRIARLRFWLAWQLASAGAEVFTGELLGWLDSLQEWRGWSETGGRSSRALLDQLDSLVIAVSGSFESESRRPVDEYCRQWLDELARRNAQVERLRERLLETEQGAARQRYADQVARALIGRALTGRQLPPAISRFILEDWYRVLKQSVWADGMESELFRHANKLLEWLVWIGDPQLSDRDRNKLYQVGEQLGDRAREIWSRVLGDEVPERSLNEVQLEIVARIRGGVQDLAPALPAGSGFSWDGSWLNLAGVTAELAAPHVGHWFVEGEGVREQRRFFFSLLEDTGEVLWTNGAGVKLGMQPWHEFLEALASGGIGPLPKATAFGQVLTDTLEVLNRVCTQQMEQRQQAALKAQARADALRRQREQAEQRRREEELARQEALEQQRREAERQRLEDERAEQARLRAEAELAAGRQIDCMGLGGWILVSSTDPEANPVRLKLAVKISASRKYVFVDRLGLNRQEFLEDQLIEGIVEGRIRVLGSSAEFDDTLSRVVGRIRVGRN
ncbi:hypothetical protein C7H09_17245 [Marinobacter fuscus]|uniref:DUF1631 domain-containing protein n=1 Tax=Marinobacter fuscus TaxID=2109942 RepID=A0A2T1K3V3_9GAMM|nr:DUF1631 family protein [Marinobacter fuscus]PSF04777.1 hypothetical protein C7H09_17245 [Marinobacter fuscus]